MVELASLMSLWSAVHGLLIRFTNFYFFLFIHLFILYSGHSLPPHLLLPIPLPTPLSYPPPIASSSLTIQERAGLL